LEVVLSQAVEDVWRCQISLRIIYDENGEVLPTPEIVGFGDAMTEAEDVENRLHRAQDAVLQWHTRVNDEDKGEILNYEYNASDDAPGFSKNVVRLEVSGPDLVDVTFIDLPGIITNADKVPPPRLPPDL
jgi:hypothetical protein